jgi:hypothetical protein
LSPESVESLDDPVLPTAFEAMHDEPRPIDIPEGVRIELAK